MSIYKQGESEALESFPYGQICSYGVSDSNTFKITAGDRDLIFETSKVRWHTQPSLQTQGNKPYSSSLQSLRRQGVLSASCVLQYKRRGTLSSHHTPPLPSSSLTDLKNPRYFSLNRGHTTCLLCLTSRDHHKLNFLVLNAVGAELYCCG